MATDINQIVFYNLLFNMVIIALNDKRCKNKV